MSMLATFVQVDADLPERIRAEPSLAERLFALGWLVPGRQSRVVAITERGAAGLAQLGIELDTRSERTPAARGAFDREARRDRASAAR